MALKSGWICFIGSLFFLCGTHIMTTSHNQWCLTFAIQDTCMTSYTWLFFPLRRLMKSLTVTSSYCSAFPALYSSHTLVFGSFPEHLGASGPAALWPGKLPHTLTISSHGWLLQVTKSQLKCHLLGEAC